MRRQNRSVWIILVLALVVAFGIWGLRGVQTEKAPPDWSFPLAEFPPADQLRKDSKTDEAKMSDETMRAVWISYLEFENILMGKSETSFREAVKAMFANCVQQNLNTVVLQVRSHGDAYYPSDYYPWSVYTSGTAGESPGFDPLTVLLEEAKQQSLSVHAWINPYRLMTGENMAKISDDFLIRRWYDEDLHMKKQDGYYYLDPGSKDVQKLICNGVSEILKKYEVDGIQIDDYFYMIPPDVFGQSEEEARKNTTALVQALSKTVKAQGEELVFGISPAGNFKEEPCSDQDQYTDLVSWCENGIIDYVAPQIYWDFDDDAAPFATILSRWETLLKDSNTTLYVGLANYKFEAKAIQKQMDAVLASDVAKGYFLFRYDNLT